MIVKLMPVIERPGQQSKLFGIWHYLADGVRKVLEYVDGDETEVTIYNALLSGQVWLQIIFADDKYAGFVCGKIDSVPNGKTFMTILYAYVKENLGEAIGLEVVRLIEESAKKCKCDVVKFSTLRDASFTKKLSDKGYRKTYVTFRKDLEAK